MKKFQRNHLLRIIIYSWPVILVLGIFVFFVGRATFHAYLRFHTANQAYLDIKGEREELEEREKILEKKFTYLSSPYGLEKELRERFNLKKPDEEIVIIIDRPPLVSELPLEESISFWQTVFHTIKKWIPMLNS